MGDGWGGGGRVELPPGAARRGGHVRGRARVRAPPPTHPPTPLPPPGACFDTNVLGPDGTPLLSWARLCALYTLPDGGGSWAETRVLLDGDDYKEAWARAVAGGGPAGADLSAGGGARELFQRAGRVHSRLQAGGLGGGWEAF